MLALMPPATLSELHATSSSSSINTMSLAVLPHSAVPTPSSCVFSMSGLSSTPAANTKRPKLSLNTSSLPTTRGGKSTTGLRLETLSVASPTSRNTFNNAYGDAETPVSIASHSTKPQLSTEPVPFNTRRPYAPTPLRTSSSDSILSSVSSVSAASVVSASSSISSATSASPTSFFTPPYRLPFHHNSILTNGPLPRLRRKKSFTTTRPMFPSTKRVSFRTQLTEEVKTEKYTLAHFDLDSSSSISTLNQSHPQKDTVHPSKPAEGSSRDNVVSGDIRPDPRSPHVGDKRESSDEDEDSDVCPATPITRYSKKPREWVWTLDPIVPCSSHQDDVDSSMHDTNKK